MSEEEWHRLVPDDATFALAAAEGNNDWRFRGYAPVGSLDDGSATGGVADLCGNGWEWTATEFASFEGFSPMSAYPEFSSDFFDGKHFVMKGGSPFTSRRVLRRSFRNWYQRNYPYAQAKFRMAWGEE